jgi:methyl-accepting chemotaxis protein
MGLFNRPDKTTNSLTITLALTFLILCTFILFFIVSFEIYFQYTTQKNVISGQQQVVAQDAANTVKNFIQNKIIILQTTAAFSNLSSATNVQLKLNLEKLLGKETSFRQLVLFNKTGTVQTKVTRLSSFEPSQLEKAIGNDFLPNVQKGELYISPVYFDKNTTEPLVAIAIPIQDVFSDYQGSLTAEVNLKFMWDLVGSIKIGKSGHAYVVDKKGNLLAYEDTSRVLSGENLQTLSEVAQFLQGNRTNKGNTVSKGIQNTQVVASYVALGIPDWAVVVELPVNEAYESLFAAIRASVFIILINLFIVTIVSIYLSKKITDPLIKLRDASLAISQGNLDTKINISTKNEIGDLALAFNQMTTKLKESYTILEKKVEERTKELEDAKKQSEQVNIDLESKVNERTAELGKLKNSLELTVAERTKELNEKLEELERMNKLMIGRELKMTELKQEIEELKKHPVNS